MCISPPVCSNSLLDFRSTPHIAQLGIDQKKSVLFLYMQFLFIIVTSTVEEYPFQLAETRIELHIWQTKTGCRSGRVSTLRTTFTNLTGSWRKRIWCSQQRIFTEREEQKVLDLLAPTHTTANIQWELLTYNVPPLTKTTNRCPLAGHDTLQAI